MATEFLHIGTGVALAAGLLAGAAMKPDLDAGAAPAEPQAVAADTGPAAPSTPELTAYSGPIPDYVLGTDLRRALSPPPAISAREPRDPVTRDETPAFEAAKVDDDMPAAAPSYPSMDGGAVYGEQAPAESDADAAAHG